ncbi:mitochondrial inner membrane protein required for protein import, variant 3 [Orbilia oligospora]|uniref:Mitochondrial inner membrane protein required for protein import n=1 Tax=Orbilia oligospora TaxID=2813651 RepID=A0A7C8MZA7_ORBOL|nr:mitochondrial inner membrane protein required for protein import [Orbilia oligospora]KAF3078747.1 mitochondrial inner membrane protein required for protein import [Orbilia oligospora]KAF3094106.1 mitochondrial inner membrane protein required for protein import [Orbilia oligospora]KAF3124518.1 mitochondrial inner membrane protein required for protein import [Orbilia oligospora]KAF3131929.1 mitochondrial inner membrane protein required for protein import, variant 3 [Orbilia oligospora]
MIAIRRRFADQFVVVFVLLLLWRYFSPWTIVVQRRGNSLETTSSNDGNVSVPIDPVKSLQGSSRGRDDIEQKLGDSEEAFLKLVGTTSKPPNLSRDGAIRMIYDIEEGEDWLDLIEGQDDHGLMALTKIVQRYIYEKQHPSDCGSQRYLILNKFPGDDAFGLGAIIQRISDYLSVAIQTDAILLYANDESPGEHFLSENRASCGRSLDCIFQELSNCSSQAQKGMNSNTQSTFSDRQFDLDVEAFLAKHKYPIPFVFEEALKKIQPDVTREMLKYWWRAQAAAYIMRFNRNTSRRLKQFRLGEDTKQLGLHWDVNGDPRNVNVPFPLPEGTISMHVRHGDKGSEMRLVPFNDYVVRAEKFSAENPLGNWKRAFLSTEDPNVIEQMKTMARITPFSYSGSNSRWTWYWTDIPRLNTGPETQLKEFGNRTDLTIKWLLQLVMAIECDVFVGTRGSGWNRLIDSLRCIWLASCKQPFLEVGFEEDWMGYGP